MFPQSWFSTCHIPQFFVPVVTIGIKVPEKIFSVSCFQFYAHCQCKETNRKNKFDSKIMSAVEVVLTSDVYYSCLTHALSTEKEEIMGLLLGDTERLTIT